MTEQRSRMCGTRIRAAVRGRLGWLAALALVAAMLAPLAVPRPAAADQITGKRVALVIGNSRYRNVSALPNPGNDARLIARTLKAAGFVLVGGDAQLDLDKPHFDDMVAKFGQAVEGVDVALFYYSGHGLQVAGVNYLVPVSANPTREQDLDFQMVSADLVLHQMSGSGTKLNIVILDACRNNPFAARGLRGSAGGLAEMRAPEGTLISYATQPGNVASDGDGRDSPFALALADSLRQPGLELLRLFNRVGLQVKKSTLGQQQPWVASSPLDGDFYFTPGAAQAAAPEAAAVPPTGEIQIAANRNAPPAALSVPVGVAAPRPVDRGFHCPRDGLVTVENGARREWIGSDPGDPHVCVSQINGVRERKLFQFFDATAGPEAEAQLAPVFNGQTEDAVAHVGKTIFAWSRAGYETIVVGGKSFDTDRFVVKVDAGAAASPHRGQWMLWYDRQSGLYLKGQYRSFAGPPSAEPPAWEVVAILLKGNGTEAAIAGAAPPLAPAAAPPGFHCPPRGTVASVNGHLVEWQGVAPDSPHMCVSRAEGRLEYRVFGFYAVGGADARAVEDALTGFFLGAGNEATLVLDGLRYTWRRLGTDRVLNHGEPVEVSVLEVETREDGVVAGLFRRGTWKLLYDARDGLLLRGSYSSLLGVRRVGVEPDAWDTASFTVGS